MNKQLDIKNDLSENVVYNMPDFPLSIGKDALSSYKNFSAISHWHDDFEFIFVCTGSMKYNVNGTNILLNEGEGIFVNSRQLHYGFSKDFEECIFFCILLHPVLLCSSPYVEKNYVAPVMANESIPYLTLHPDKEYEKNVLKLLNAMYGCHNDKLFPLKIQSLFFSIWENLFLLSGHTEQQPVSENQHLSILKDMIRFIYENYTEKISLAQISQAGKIGKTSCCNIFQKYTNHTPISYLKNYRLKKSIELLENTDKTISEICFETGFSGASYYTETFHRLYGCTPTEYRLKHAEQQK